MQSYQLAVGQLPGLGHAESRSTPNRADPPHPFIQKQAGILQSSRRPRWQNGTAQYKTQAS